MKTCTSATLYWEKAAYDCEKGRSGKAYNTIRKQESLWVNHLCAAFGKRYIDEISAAEVVDYLTELYYNRGFECNFYPNIPCENLHKCNPVLGEGRL